MICPNCASANPENAKFCNQCGAPLPAACANCGHPNPAGSKFCNNCGQPLSTPAREPPAPAQASRVPPSGNASLEGERRKVTMLFCDVKGSTSASERMDPEDWTEIMNGVFGYMLRPVYHFGGTVARLMGDAILAFFGAPVGHEDDPQRAILAGLEILEAFKPHREQLLQQWGVEIDLRVGINTGWVVVGEVGAGQDKEYTAMGDAINLAARMEQTAQPGTVHITADTYQAVAPFFEVEDLGGIQVKGKRDTVHTYRVLRIATTPGRLRGIEGLASPLVGRATELGLLTEAVAQLGKGIGGIVCLIGAAGLGKSRLVDELRAHVQTSRPSVRWVETVSLSYEAEQPYALFQRLIRRLAGLDPGDPTPVARQRLDALLSDGRSDAGEDARRVLQALLGRSRGAEEPPLEGETFKGQLYRVMASLWHTWASAGPVVLVCDDLHWSDPASVALLLRLLAVTERAPLLLLCALRPDRHAPAWELRETAERDFAHRYTEISLGPLSVGEGGQLVDNLLRISDLPPGLRARILEKSEGNPFYVEEVVRTLIDGGSVVRDESGERWRTTREGVSLEIPDNLQALLVARIDRLDEDTRRTLQLASVVGRSFHYRVLAQVAQALRPQELDRQLLTLQRAGLIREVTRLPEVEYAFRHVLTQEAAYHTLLVRQRRTFHRRVAQAIESLFPDRLEEMAVPLAYHYDEAQDAERARAYYVLAGDVAYRLYALAEAAAHYGRAIALAALARVGEEHLVYLYTRRGRALELQHHYDAALDNYAELEALAEARGDPALKLAHLLCLGTVQATAEGAQEPGVAWSTSQQALRLARELGDRKAEARALWNLMLTDTFSGRNLERARQNGEASLAIARELGWTEQMAYTLEDLAMVLSRPGLHRRSQEALDEAQTRWRSLNNLPMLANNLSASAHRYSMMGEYEQAIRVAEEGMHTARSVENVMSYTTGAMNVAWAFRERGLYALAMQDLEEAIRWCTESGAFGLAGAARIQLALLCADLGLGERGWALLQGLEQELYQAPAVFRRQSYMYAVVAQLHLTRGDLTSAQEAIDRAACDIDAAMSFPHTDLHCVEVMCQVALASGAYDRVVATARELLTALEDAELRGGRPMAYCLMGRALAAKGDSAGAHAALTRAQTEAAAQGTRRVMWQTLAALAGVEEVRGDAAVADDLRATAREIVQNIANHTPQGESRDALLALAPVRRLFASTKAT